MQNNEEIKPTPQKVEQKELKHEYKILEDGTVISTQTQVLEFTWPAREFISLLRQNEQALENTRKAMSEDHLKKMKEQEEKIQKEIEKLKPLAEESEKKAKKAYDEMLIDGLTKSLQNKLKEKELDEGWWFNIWHRTKQERKDEVMQRLSTEEKTAVLKAMMKLKRKGIIK